MQVVVVGAFMTALVLLVLAAPVVAAQVEKQRLGYPAPQILGVVVAAADI
jgi:hypothetical protein